MQGNQPVKYPVVFFWQRMGGAAGYYRIMWNEADYKWYSRSGHYGKRLDIATKCYSLQEVNEFYETVDEKSGLHYAILCFVDYVASLTDRKFPRRST